MTTTSTPYLHTLAELWEDESGCPSAILSGIVPDLDHLRRGGPHVSIQDLQRFGNYPDYSTPIPLGRPPLVKNLTAGCAIDMSMNKSDMVRTYRRVYPVFLNRHNDPRARYTNAINVYDGVHQPRRFNFQTGANTAATWDHSWHNHWDGVRALWDPGYVGSEAVWTAVKAVHSMLRGESLPTYLASIGQGVAQTSQEEAMYIFKSADGRWYKGNGVVNVALLVNDEFPITRHINDNKYVWKERFLGVFDNGNPVGNPQVFGQWPVTTAPELPPLAKITA